jgi:DNA-binding transcriptional regulator YdaS (Cro superfamily)
MMTDSQIIDLLGGVTAVAKKLRISPPAVCGWRKYGMPTDKKMFLAAEIEKASNGELCRKKLFPMDWKIVWPEVK